jgi:hypothetical protein
MKTYTADDVTATAREAGRNVVHTVTVEGGSVVNGTRRSAHRYAYAICEWQRRSDFDEPATLIVKRWSQSPKSGTGAFAVPVRSVDTDGPRALYDKFGGRPN